MKGLAVVLALGLLAIAAAAVSTEGPEAPVTFSETIAPIIFERCTGCHRTDGVAPFALESYADAAKHARKIAAATRTRAMPPWHAESGSYAFKYDRRLTGDQIALIQRWVDGGLREGDRSRLPKLPDVPSGWQLGKPDLVAELPSGFQVPAHGEDVYRNFVIPLSLAEDKWVRAIEFRPSALSSVHHVLFFGDTSGSARQADAADAEPGFAGMGGRRWRSAPLGGWTPGQQPHLLPDGIALPLPKGADLVLQYHFHPHGKAETERPQIGLHFADRAPARTLTGLQLPVLFGFFAGIDIPAGARDFRVRDSFVLPVDAEAVVIGAHAHYLGREMKMTATLPSGEQKTLLWIKRWDFNWQDRYYFQDLVPLPKGTRLDAEIAWDNSTDNPDNPSDPPRRVTWGEQSTDEMGSIGLQVLPTRESDLETLKRAWRQHVWRSVGSGALGALRSRLP